MKYWKYYLLAVLIIALDQTSKLLVYTNMTMGVSGEINVIGDWFRLHYLLNPGMAFGIELDFLNEYGKLFLTIFRLLASVAIAYAIYVLYQRKAHTGMIVCVALILGGAIGNVIDSVFYGVFMEGNMIPGSSSPWFHGQVIDMLYFPLFEGYFPEWVPQVGGNYFLFFSPVFNIADSSIFVGVTSIIIFQKHFTFPDAIPAMPQNEEAHTENENTASGFTAPPSGVDLTSENEEKTTL